MLKHKKISIFAYTFQLLGVFWTDLNAIFDNLFSGLFVHHQIKTNFLFERQTVTTSFDWKNLMEFYGQTMVWLFDTLKLNVEKCKWADYLSNFSPKGRSTNRFQKSRWNTLIVGNSGVRLLLKIEKGQPLQKIWAVKRTFHPLSLNSIYQKE